MIKNELEWSAKGVHQKVISMLPSGRLRILDAGSGTGILSQELTELGHEVYSIDLKNQANLKVRFKKADLNKDIPFPDKCFDVILLVEVIEHLENPRHFFREVKRLLKKRGVLILTTPNIFHWRSRLKFLLFGKVWGSSEPEYLINGHITILTLINIQRICQEYRLWTDLITYNNSNNKLFGDDLMVRIRRR